MVVRSGLALLLASACAFGASDPNRTLARLREIVNSQAERIPNYTCVQTIDRLSYWSGASGAPRPSRSPLKCDEIAALKRKGNYRLVPITSERFRLDVRAGARDEMYSWAGASRFGDRPLHELLGSGPSSTGAFGPMLIDTILDAPEFSFQGEKTVNGRSAYIYSFSVPVDRSQYLFVMRGGSELPLAYHGTILADRDTGAPVQLSIVASDLPPATNSCQIASVLDYGRTRIGDGDFFLPEKAIQRFVTPGGVRPGVEAENTVRFSSCREYRADSAISFGNAPTPAPAAAANPAPQPDFPPDLAVSIALTGRIDSEVAAAGDPFTGRLVKPVLDRNKNPVAPEGAVVHGRVTGVIHYLAIPSPVVIFRLSVETLELGDREIPFRLSGKNSWVLRAPPGRGLQSRGLVIGEMPEWVPSGDLELKCFAKRCVLRDGHRTDWVTVSKP